jgi:phage-related protein/phosphotransferase system HPr-like phosphotransfer protein
MAGGVDKVKVRVRPDLTGFEQTVKKTTNKKRQTIIQAMLDTRAADRELAKLKGSKTYLDLDVRLDGAKKDLTKLKATLDSLKDSRVTIQADRDQAADAVRSLQAQLRGLTGEQRVKIEADTAAAKQHLADLEKLLRDNKRVTVDVQADTKKATQNLKDIERDRQVLIEADLDAVNARRAILTLTRDRILEIKARLDSTQAVAGIKSMMAGLTGMSLLSSWGRSLQGLVSNLPQMAMSLSMLAPMIASVAAVALSALGAIGPLAASIAQLGPGALAGVAGLGAMAASVGVLVVAFKDLDAADAPATAKAFNQVLTETKDRLHDVRLGIQDAFFAGGDDWTGTFQSMVDTLLPGLQSGLGRVGASMGWLTEGVMASLRDGLTGGALDGFLGQTSTMLDRAADGIAGMVTGLTQIGLKGGAVLPAIGDWVTDIGTRFADWAAGADIAGMLERAATQAGHLWDAVKNVGGIIKGLFTSMNTGGGTGLEGLAAALGSIRAVVESPGFQQAMQTIFAGAAAGAKALQAVLGPLGDAFQALAPTIGAALESLAGTFAGVLEGIAGALAQPMVADGIQAALQGISEIAAAIPWDVLGESLGLIGAMIGQIAPLISSLMATLAPMLPVILGAVSAIIPPVVELVQAVLPALASILGVVAGLISALAPIIGALVPVIQALAPVISQIAELIGGRMGSQFQFIANLINSVIVPVIQFLAGIISTVVGVISALMQGDFQGAWNIASSAVSGAVSAIGGFIGGLVSNITGAIGGLVSNVVGTVQGWWSSMTSTVSAGVDSVVSWVTGLPGRILSAFGSIGGLLRNAGSAIIDGFLGGLKSAFEGVKNFVGGIAGWIADHKGPLSYDYTLLQPAGGKIMGGFKDALIVGMKDVEKLVSGFAPTVATSLNVNNASNTNGTIAAPVAAAPVINISFGDVTVRDEQNIRSLADQIGGVVDARLRAQGRLGLQIGG